jgi:hypothetical protein
MQRFITTLQKVNDMYIGTLFDTNKGEKVFESSPHPTQTQATDEISAFLLNQEPDTAKTYSNQVMHLPVKSIGMSPTKKCCGRA